MTAERRTGPKKTKPPEYRLSAWKSFDERSQKPTTTILLETTRQFSTFRYRIGVAEIVSGRDIRWTVMGLSPPGLDLPESGVAEFRREFADLDGTYRLHIEGLDGESSTFTLVVEEGRPVLSGNSSRVALSAEPASPRNRKRISRT